MTLYPSWYWGIYDRSDVIRMSLKAKLAALVAIFLWASAFVGIRAGLAGYSPGGLALLRYLIASLCMAILYYISSFSIKIEKKDILGLLFTGIFGIGFYNIALNYGELSVSAGMASFVVSQSPLMTAFLSYLCFSEKMNKRRALGFLLGLIGVGFISFAASPENLKINMGILYVLAAAFSGSCYSILQKPFLRKYPAFIATTFVIWGGTLFLLIHANDLYHDLQHAPWQATLMVIYLGIFPAAGGYLAWSYVLSEMSPVQAGSFLYYTPFVATLMGWWYLGETPHLLAIFGGILAIAGVWLVHQSYRLHYSIYK